MKRVGFRSPSKKVIFCWWRDPRRRKNLHCFCEKFSWCNTGCVWESWRPETVSRDLCSKRASWVFILIDSPSFDCCTMVQVWKKEIFGSELPSRLGAPGCKKYLLSGYPFLRFFTKIEIFCLGGTFVFMFLWGAPPGQNVANFGKVIYSPRTHRELIVFRPCIAITRNLGILALQVLPEIIKLLC